ncbi:NAD(P)/FAD-dependent oxidoreductase [Thermogemmatispora carboxidivorans]|uniref:NAD(P)/FAD-dependent oxidoreductase n=1 Tax=Thermogemmatispora carboxidivorans TaxID=1382306 RepID=UPI00069B8406|nr:FAD-dependent oxidoreductase [Thermogemmatispora carboxidivorans]
MQKTALPAWFGDSRIEASADVVIVGNGIAGLTAAIEARRFAPESTILVLTEQCYPTIHTPALRQVLSGRVSRSQLLAYPEGTEQARGIKVGIARVEVIDAVERRLLVAGGGVVHYGILLLATGSVARGLPEGLPGAALDGVLTLHRLPDYLDVRRRLREVREVAVIGGGVHGAETVMSLLHIGKRVHWFIRGSYCLPRLLNRVAAELVLRHVERAGALVHLESEVIGFVGRVGELAGVATADGRVIPAQLALVCTGTRPALDLATRSTLPLVYEEQQGILVDGRLCTSVPGILAAGDVAAWRHPLSGFYRSQPSWHAAVLQGRVAAATMTGQVVTQVSEVIGAPWQATRLGSLSILAVGDPLAEAAEVKVLTRHGKQSYHRLALVGDRLVGYLALGKAQPDALAIKRLIDEALPVGVIQDALLRGDFDARAYFAQLRSSKLYTLTAPGRLAERTLATSRCAPPLSPPLGTTPAVAGWQAPPQGGEPFLQGSVSRRRPQTEPLRRLIPAQHGANVANAAGSGALADLDSWAGGLEPEPLPRRLSLPASLSQPNPRPLRYCR